MPTDEVLTDELCAVIEENAEEVCRTDSLSREDWLKYRKTGIGGSDAAAAIGLNPWASPFSLWADKTSAFVSDEDNDFMRWGRRLEEPIGLGFSEDTGIPVQRYPYMMRSKNWPWMVVNIDFLAPESIVEVKNVGARKSHEWDNGAVPQSYAIQGQHACAVLGLSGVHFAPLIGGNELRPVYVERNDRLIENLVEAERKFWELVDNNTPPDIDGSAATTRAIKGMFADPDSESEIELGGQRDAVGRSVGDLLQLRAIAKTNIKEQQEVIDEIENQLFAWIGNYEIATVHGETLFTWKRQTRGGYEVKPSSFRRLHVAKQRAK